MVVRKLQYIKKAVKDIGMTFDYNDILLATEKDRDICAIYHKKGSMELDIEIGVKEVVCPTCGQNQVSSDEMLVCGECDSMELCSDCDDYNWKSLMKDGVCVEC